MLKGKKILLGVTGSIAAYKTATLVRLLVKNGADVRVVLTPSALSFVTPLTLATLSKNPVSSEFVEDEETGEWTNHVELGKWADLFLIAPLSANTLSKLTSGVCDNLLMAVYLSADCPVMIAPAMDLDMAAHWTTDENIDKLKSRNVSVIDFDEGELASGLEGKGRMAEPESILEKVTEFFDVKSSLKGRKVLITAGPTYEAIDAVRFIGNHSSGKMGFALAQVAADRGAEVTLVTGPTALTIAHANIKRVDVVSAENMFDAVDQRFGESDVLIMSAAVADYRPSNPVGRKLKKGTDDLTTIELETTKDVLATMGARKENQVVVGFALETNNELENGKSKLENKNLDLLVLNSLNVEGAGFGTDTNKVWILGKNDEINESEVKSKAEIAALIVDRIEIFF